MTSTPEQLTALGDPVRWRIAALLAARPRSVGVVAQLAGLRQPQTTKHLQALERAGLVTARRVAQRRYYLLDGERLHALAAELTALAATVDANRDTFDSLDAYVATVDAERLAADRARWADDRVFDFDRRVPAPREVVWRHLTQPDLLAAWWTPPGLRMSRLVFEAAAGGRIEQEYVEADDADGSGGVLGYAEGTVTAADAPARLQFRLSPRLPDGSVAFTGHYDMRLREDAGTTALAVSLRITDSTVQSADFIAGIPIGWGQSLDALVAAATTTPSAEHQPHPKEHS